MAHFQDLTACLPVPLPVEGDRAIFTSLPSATGEGYRLVSWSGGVRAEERAELTRRAPSHDSLCETHAEACGSFTFRLAASGRTVFGVSRFAGAEHTRRGGGRVWTDLVLVPRQELDRGSLLPVSVRRALKSASGDIHGGVLPTLVIDGDTGGIPDLDVRGDEVGRVAGLAGLLAAAVPSVVAVGAASSRVLEAGLGVLPAVVRATVAASAGLRFSRARQVTVTVVDRLDPEIARATRGHGIACIDEGALTARREGPLDAWLRLAGRWLGEGRGVDVVRLANALTGEWDACGIERVAALAEAVDRGHEPAEALSRLLIRRPAAA